MIAIAFKCKGCTKRSPGCHDTCEDYKADLEKLEKAKANRDADKDIRQYERKQQMIAAERRARIKNCKERGRVKPFHHRDLRER